MASQGTLPPWHCSLCQSFCSSAQELAFHVLRGEEHRGKLSRFAPQQLKELSRLPYFLDTYMRNEEPILGLEYIEEEKLDSVFYKYTCRLCELEGEVYETFLHLTEEDHMVRYIDRHHSSLSLKADKYQKKSHFLEVLKERALEIQRQYGRKQIQLKQHVVDDLSPSVEAKPPPCQDWSKKGIPFLHDGKGLISRRICSLCNVTCFSSLNLCSHVVGSKHREKLTQTAPKKVQELGRLQYFLDNHMKEDLLLGLEYIVEEKLDSGSYKFTCQLCNVGGDMPFTITHMTYVGHVESYVDRHHSDLSLGAYTYAKRVDYMEALTRIAGIIYDKYGRQKIELKAADVSHPASGELAALPPDGDCKNSEALLLDGAYLQKRFTCSVCGVLCLSLVQLFNHVMGKKHRYFLNKSAPQKIEEMTRLKDFLKTHMKEDPILGLEYIVEEQLDSTSYKYSCQLCNMEGQLLQIVTHITDVEHTSSYIDKHHNKLSLIPYMYCTRADYIKALTERASEIQAKYGRKEIQMKISDNGDPVQAKMPSSHPKGDGKKGNILLPVGIDIKRERICCLCGVSFDSLVYLSNHVMSVKHRINLRLTTPEQMRDLGSLQYFLDTHAKEDPLLGLEYIVEEQLDSTSYKYSCQLCQVEGNFLQIIFHIIEEYHVAHYIHKHHGELALEKYSFSSSADYVQALTATVVDIHAKYGRKDIQLIISDVTGPTWGKVAPLFPEDDVRKDGTLPSGKKNVKKEFPCSLCNVICPSVVQLCDHILSSDHRGKLERKAPTEAFELGRLQYFLDTYLQEEPILGLEYIVEKCLGTSYNYTCQLCDVEAELRQTLIHIAGEDHVLCYLEQHHSKFIPSLKNCRKAKFFATLNKIVYQIHKKHGCKRVMPKDVDGASPAKAARLSVEDNGLESGSSLSADEIETEL